MRWISIATIVVVVVVAEDDDELDIIISRIEKRNIDMQLSVEWTDRPIEDKEDYTNILKKVYSMSSM